MLLALCALSSLHEDNLRGSLPTQKIVCARCQGAITGREIQTVGLGPLSQREGKRNPERPASPFNYCHGILAKCHVRPNRMPWGKPATTPCMPRTASCTARVPTVYSTAHLHLLLLLYSCVPKRTTADKRVHPIGGCQCLANPFRLLSYHIHSADTRCGHHRWFWPPIPTALVWMSSPCRKWKCLGPEPREGLVWFHFNSITRARTGQLGG